MMNDFSKAHKNQSYENSVFSSKPNFMAINSTKNNESYQMFIYNLVIESPGHNDYGVALFKNNNLVYWGLVENMKKSDDYLIQELGTEASKAIIAKEEE